MTDQMNSKKTLRWILVGFCIVFLITGLYFLGQKNDLWMVICLAIGIGSGVGVQVLNFLIWPEKYYPKGISKEAYEAENPLLLKNRRFLIWIASIVLFLISLFLFFYR